MTARRACPCCGDEGRRESLFAQRFAMIDGVSVVDGYDVVACGRCGVTFADGVPSQDAFDRYYRDASKYIYAQRGGAESPADAARLAVSASTIARFEPHHDARVMDVGCASGRLLAELRRLGFSNIRGIDPSPECAAAARRIHDVDVQAMTLGQLADEGEPFDFLVCIGVLEHLVDVQRSLAQLHRVTTPGGGIYLEVPDVTGFADWPNAPYQEFSVEHINYFSPGSLRRTLRAAGFEMEWHEQGSPIQAGTTRVANLAAFARRSTPAQPGERDDASVQSVRRYLAACEPMARAIEGRVDELAGSTERFVLWGTGTQTLRLLATSRLADASIEVFTDSNSYYHMKRVAGRPILPPDDAVKLGLPVIIASRGFAPEIGDQIRANSGQNLIVRALFDGL